MPRAAADVFNAIAESRRRDILSFLAPDERSVGDIVTVLVSVYLRELGVPVPSIYGPSADENPFAQRQASAATV